MSADKYMNVRELIEALAEFPEGALVLDCSNFDDGDHDCVRLLKVVPINGRPCLVFDTTVVKP